MPEAKPTETNQAPSGPVTFVRDASFDSLDLDAFALFKTRVTKETRHTIFTTKDKSAAYYIIEGKQTKTTSADARAFIKEAAIALDGMGEAELSSYLIAGGKRKGHPGGVLIAKGAAPINGEDGYVEWHVTEPESFGVGKETGGGAVDYRERQTFSKVTKGEPILTWHAPTSGTNGRDIFGKTIEAVPGQPNKPRAGTNVSVDGQGVKMSAGIDGVVKLEEEAVHVRLMLEVQDVDFKSGNIRFDGDVQVNGVVQEGFEVVSEGAVQVLKGVGKATVIGRTLFIEGPATGATLQSEEHAEIKVIESSHLRVGSDLKLNGDCVNTTVHVGGDLKGEKARVSGGEINALGWITLGAVVSGESDICSSTRTISLPELDEVDAKRAALSEAIQKIDAALNSDEEEGSKAKLTLQQKAALNALRKKREELAKDLEEADKERRIQLSRKLKGVARGIVVLDGIASGARFKIDTLFWEADQALEGAWQFTLAEDGYSIVVEPHTPDAE